MTISKFLEYLELEKNYSFHTCEAYRRDLEQFQSFLREKGHDTLTRVEYGQIRSWITELSGSVSNRSINRKLASLKAFYVYLQRIGERGSNPLSAHRSLKTESKIALPLSETEMQELLEAMRFEDSFEGRRDQLLIELLYGTGMRRRELMDLQQGDVDFSSSVLKVTGKRNKQRFIPLLPELSDLIRQYLSALPPHFPKSSESPLLMTSKGRTLYPTFVYRVINKYLQEVSTKVKKSPHILRHTFATHLLNRGADLNSVKELLGHTSLASTQVYTHSSIEDLKKVHLAAHPRSKED